MYHGISGRPLLAVLLPLAPSLRRHLGNQALKRTESVHFDRARHLLVMSWAHFIVISC
jgi:hypothetical protein